MTSYISPFTGDVVVPTDVSYVSYTLAASLQLTWPANGTDADNVAARIMDVQTPNFAFKLKMPPASQTSVGTDALIRNTGAVNLEVTNTNLGTITTILPGVAAYIYLTDNTTENGVWGVFTFGAGTSTANAATLAGYGILAAGLTLNQSHPVTNLTASYVFSAADRAQVLEWPTSGGTTTVTLPLASTLGNNWFFMFKNNGTGIVNLATTSGELLDGSASSKTFAPSESAFVICNGSAFITVGYGVSTLFNFTAATKVLSTGTVTLTASEASNTIQTFTGTLTGNVTVYFPPVVNLYVVSNQTTGPYTVTIGTTLGLTVVVPTGTQATVVCDGTDFLNANTTTIVGSAVSFIDGSASNPAAFFASETNTGIFRSAPGEFAISILGTKRGAFTATGFEITGTGNFTGGISGGSF